MLFRGVGGATQLPVSRLRHELTDVGFADIATYINSGNAVLRSSHGVKATRDLIIKCVAERLGFEKEVFVVPAAEWKRAVEHNPFPQAVNAPTRLHLFYLSEAPGTDAVEAFKARAVGEEVTVFGRVLYLWTPFPVSESKLPAILDRILAVKSTARNWRTSSKLLEMLEAM